MILFVCKLFPFLSYLSVYLIRSCHLTLITLLYPYHIFHQVNLSPNCLSASSVFIYSTLRTLHFSNILHFFSLKVNIILTSIPTLMSGLQELSQQTPQHPETYIYRRISLPLLQLYRFHIPPSKVPCTSSQPPTSASHVALRQPTS